MTHDLFHKRNWICPTTCISWSKATRRMVSTVGGATLEVVKHCVDNQRNRYYAPFSAS